MIAPDADFIRKSIIHIGPKDLPQYRSAYHVGVNSKELKEEEL